MTHALVDSGYLAALEVSNDQYHGRASMHWKQTRTSSSLNLLTTSFIFDELVTFLNSRGQHAKAVEVGEQLLQSQLIEFVDVDRLLFNQGWDFFRQHQDKTYSLTDCISFVLMRKEGIATAFTFDKHFQQAGFDIEPGEPRAS